MLASIFGIVLLMQQYIEIEAAMDAKSVPVMDGNSGTNRIWERWQPLVVVEEGCNAYPMVTHEGVLAQGWNSYERDCHKRKVSSLNTHSD